VIGIEPTIEPWEGSLLPLQHTRALEILPRARFQPTELSRRLPPMAVDASHIALPDLGSNASPTLARHHAADVGQLLNRIPVIELKHDGVVDATVDTRMGHEVSHYLASILLSPPVHLGDGPPDVVSLVGQVVRMPVRRVALSAIRIQRAASFVGERELSGRLVCTARRAPEEA
jgi:hypothetical protein